LSTLDGVDRGQVAVAAYGSAARLRSPVGEELELALASELLEARSPEDVARVLGRVHRAVGTAACATSPSGRALVGLIGPFVGRTVFALGTAAIGPSTRIGGREVGAGRLLGLELEGLSPEDREFAVARQLVRFAGAASRLACSGPQGTQPRARALRAAALASRSFAPGLLPALRRTKPPAPRGPAPGPSASRRWPRTGRWLRRGRAIVLLT
jgi:hypothetical protein